MDGEIVGMVAIFCLFGWIPMKVMFSHRQRMAEIKSRQVGNVDGIREEIAELRSEVQALRDTSVKFDISFDAALSSLEDRVENMEMRRVSPVQDESVTMQSGRG